MLTFVVVVDVLSLPKELMAYDNAVSVSHRHEWASFWSNHGAPKAAKEDPVAEESLFLFQADDDDACCSFDALDVLFSLLRVPVSNQATNS